MAMYRINLFGKGNEFTIGTIPKETWDYIQETFDGSESDYLEALDNGDVPEEHQLASESWNMYECDDLWHYDGCWASYFRLDIEKLNDDEFEGEVVFTCEDDKTYEHGIKIEIDCTSIDDSIPYLCTWSSVAKGLYLTGDFEIDGEFDPKKLKILCKQVSFNNDEYYDRIVTGFEYDGEEIECEFDSTDGKGDTLRFIEVEQFPVEEEDGE